MPALRFRGGGRCFGLQLWMPCSLLRWTGSGARWLPSAAVPRRLLPRPQGLPGSLAGRRPHLHSRGLLKLHTRYGLQGCSPTFRGLYRVQPTTRLGGSSPHLVSRLFSRPRTPGRVSPRQAKLERPVPAPRRHGQAVESCPWRKHSRQPRPRSCGRLRSAKLREMRLTSSTAFPR